jgi:protein-disulfide isomerase
MNRRHLLLTLSLAPFVDDLVAVRRANATQARPVDVDAIFNDPEGPVAGNPQGDVTIVAFIDYNCPFCKKSAPKLRRFAAADGRIRLVYKDWPILAPSSVVAAHGQATDALLARNAAEADALGLKGTPVFLAGSSFVCVHVAAKGVMRAP